MKPRHALLVACGLLAAELAAQPASPELADIIRERDATLSRIVTILEARYRTGGGDEHTLFAARLALATFHRDVAPTQAEKIASQRAIVALREERLTNLKGRAAAGLSNDVELLQATDELLAAKQALLELIDGSKR